MPPKPKPQNVSRLGSIRRGQLLNRLNVLHFQDIPLLVCLRHKNHGHTIRVKAQPQMTIDEHAVATWQKDSSFPATLPAFELESIILPGNRRTFEFTPERFWIDELTIRFLVPERAEEFGARKHLRYDCGEQNLAISVAQNTLVFRGRLLDYSVAGMLVELTATTRQNLAWMNPTIPATLNVERTGTIIYSDQVTVHEKPELGQYLLVPNRLPAPRFRPKTFRARRQKFTPSPDLVFDHPVTGRRHTLKIHDLGSLGFSVDEQAPTSVLIPGLQIADAVLSFANSLCLSCTVQVVYSRQAEEEPQETVRSGFAILHIDLQDHLKLISLIQQAQDPRTYVNNQVDPEDLFEFFFETGFLYPHKYAEIAGNREQFRKAFAKLYRQGAEIGRHFVYQDAGQIIGHFATLRVYRETWMNHHHAALNSHRAGLRVVRAISEYINDSYQLNQTNINYIIGYYQATNRFPQHYFGEFVQSVNDPTKTSLDPLAYLKDATSFGCDPGELAGDWTFERAKTADIVEFRGFYNKISGGLLPDALDLTPQRFDDQTLADNYATNGLTRKRWVYALRHQHTLKALIDVQDSDLGLNLSEITNATTVYVIDTDACHRDVLRFAVCALAIRYNKMNHPVMFFPSNYLAHYNIPCDKEYTLWALNVKTDYGQAYMEWMNRYCR